MAEGRAFRVIACPTTRRVASSGPVVRGILYRLEDGIHRYSQMSSNSEIFFQLDAYNLKKKQVYMCDGKEQDLEARQANFFSSFHDRAV